MAKKPYKKILVVKPSSLGDIVHSLPFLNSIRKCLPEAQIHWLVARGFDGLLADHPMLDKVWVINKEQWKKINAAGKTINELRALYRNLKKENYDLVVDLQGLLRSGVLTGVTGSATRVGFKEAREGSRLFYTHTVKGGRDVHAVERYLKVASFLGCKTDEIKFPFPTLPAAHSLGLALPEQYVVIAPSAGKEANRWPAERFGKLASLLPLKSVVVSSKADEYLANEVVSHSVGQAVSIAGKTNLKELAAVIKEARYFISNDTGPMHIAAAFGVPVFAIFGPANPLRTGPYGDMHTVIAEDISCAPCYRKKKCRNWICIDSISVEKVLSAITEKTSS